MFLDGQHSGFLIKANLFNNELTAMNKLIDRQKKERSTMELRSQCLLGLRTFALVFAALLEANPPLSAGRAVTPPTSARRFPLRRHYAQTARHPA